ncbi:hypothetical protein GCM10009425_49110 [Pseudomonas asuensis]|uniref:Uncharacterized protein n=1 Tax=Pseudomonas asuensis TaxID=1825787 RepID=A0ABQ2H3R5_9PSED|nr:hypothetical protein GCM10009425_49110 [Pseudomonas asuensis]
MSIKPALKTDTQLAHTGQPGIGTLHHPAMLAKSLLAIYSFTGDSISDPSLAQMSMAALYVIRFVSV